MCFDAIYRATEQRRCRDGLCVGSCATPPPPSQGGLVITQAYRSTLDQFVTNWLLRQLDQLHLSDDQVLLLVLLAPHCDHTACC